MYTPQNVRRGPDGYSAELLQVTTGCSYDKCRFCNLTNGEPFSVVPLEHIISDLDEIAANVRHPRSVFLLTEDPMGLPNDKLMPVLKLIRKKLPTVSKVTGFIRVRDIKRKSDEDLQEMASMGPLKAIVGVESGWDEVLAEMNKDQTSADTIEQLHRLEEVGIEYSVFYLCGIAGKGRGQENALKSAELYSQLHPTRIEIVSFTPFPGTQLREDILSGDFEMAPESETMLEVATFIENLDCETMVVAEHDTNLFRIEGPLPQAREHMVEVLRWRAANVDDEKLRESRFLMKG